MTIAYHPERQDEWFPVRADEALDSQAAAYLAQCWSDLEESEIAALQSDRKDGLRVVSFDGRPKSLLERIGKKTGIWDDLEPVAKGAPPKKKGRYKVLDRLGVNLTSQAIEGTLEGGIVAPLAVKLSAGQAPGRDVNVVVGEAGLASASWRSCWGSSTGQHAYSAPTGGGAGSAFAGASVG